MRRCSSVLGFLPLDKAYATLQPKAAASAELGYSQTCRKYPTTQVARSRRVRRILYIQRLYASDHDEFNAPHVEIAWYPSRRDACEFGLPGSTYLQSLVLAWASAKPTRRTSETS